MESAPIKLYARELGNHVSRDAVARASKQSHDKKLNGRRPDRSASAEVSDASSAPTGEATVEGSSSSASAPATTAADDSVPSLVIECPPVACKSELEVCIADNQVEPLSTGRSSNASTDNESRASSTAPHSYPSEVFEPNDVVHEDTVTHGPMFMFWQLMGWYNAGSDDPIVSPDVFGCLQLPLPVQCFGSAQGPYIAKIRDEFLNHILDEFKMSAPWKESVRKTFSPIPKRIPRERAYVMGSPFLDLALGVSTHIIGSMSQLLFPEGRKKSGGNKENLQFDEMLPPERNCTWIMCSTCMKWRRIAWFVDPKPVLDCASWTCDMNSWDPEQASCEAEECYDAQNESTDMIHSDPILEALDFLDGLVKPSLDDCPLGSQKDVFCIRNLRWYKGKIIRQLPHSEPNGEDKVCIHFQGWTDKFNEEIELNSGRIQPFGVYTSKSSKAVWKIPANIAPKNGSKKVPQKKNTPKRKTSQQVVEKKRVYSISDGQSIIASSGPQKKSKINRK